MTKIMLAIALIVGLSFIRLDRWSPIVRTYARSFGEIVKGQVPPNDGVVVLQSNGNRPILIGRPSIQQVVNDLRNKADLIVVAEVAGMIAHETKAHDWIETELSLYVHEFVVKSQQLTDVQNSRKQQINVSGGELFVGDKLVKTEGMFSLKIGAVYLLCFAKAKNGAPFLTWAYPPLLVEGGRLLSNRGDFHPRYYDPLGGQAVSKIVTFLKRA